MKKDSIVMMCLACSVVGLLVGHFGWTQVPLVDKIEFSPQIELEFSKPVFWIIEKQLPVPDPIIKTVVVIEREEVPIIPHRPKDLEEVKDFIRWYKFNVPWMPFGSNRCWLDAALVEDIAFAKGLNLNVNYGTYNSNTGKSNPFHCVINFNIGDKPYLMNAVTLEKNCIGYIVGYEEYDDTLWKEYVDWGRWGR